MGDAHRHVSCATLLDHACPMYIWWRIAKATRPDLRYMRRSGHGYLVAPPGFAPKPWAPLRRGRPTLHPSGCSRMPHLFPSVLATDPVLQDADQSRLRLSIAAGEVRFLPGSTYDVEGDHPSPPLPPHEGPHPQSHADVGPFVMWRSPETHLFRARWTSTPPPRSAGR